MPSHPAATIPLMPPPFSSYAFFIFFSFSFVIESAIDDYTSGFTYIDKLTDGKLSGIKEKFVTKMSELKESVSGKVEDLQETISEKMKNVGIKSAYQ